LSLRSYGSRSKPSKSPIFRWLIVAAAIGAFDLETTAAFAAVPGQKAIAREFGNALVVRTGEQNETKKLSPDDLKERGIKLRAELEKTFDRLGEAGKLSYVNDITASIVPYISAGMTFEESESVLRAAGFSVRPHPGAREEQDPHRSRDWYAVHAAIPEFSRRVPGNVAVYVSLHPETPGDYANVKDVKAVMFVTIL
jgi:hypothetical protein